MGWLHAFSLVDTYKCMLTFAFFLKFCEIQYFKWHIMVKLKFQGRIWPQLNDGGWVTTQCWSWWSWSWWRRLAKLINSLRIRKVICLKVTKGENEWKIHLKQMDWMIKRAEFSLVDLKNSHLLTKFTRELRQSVRWKNCLCLLTTREVLPLSTPSEF